MRITPTAAVLLLALGLGERGFSDDGYVGIYADSLGTQPCASVAPPSSMTLYVIAKTEGASANGIMGAEFRIEVTNSSGWLVAYSPPSEASAALGNPVDMSDDPEDNSGVTMAFSECQAPVAGIIQLGTLQAFNWGGSPTTLEVKRHNTPSNGLFTCPLFTMCDAPVVLR